MTCPLQKWWLAALVCDRGEYGLDFERTKRRYCLRMGGHDDEATSARGIVDGGEDDRMRYHAVPGEYLHEFTPSRVVSDGRGC